MPNDDPGDSPDHEESASEMRERGYERATLNVELDMAFINLLSRQATREGKEPEELLRDMASVPLKSRFHKRWRNLECNVDVGVPTECYEEAQLWAEHYGTELDEVMINLVDWNPNWIPTDGTRDVDCGDGPER